MHAKKVYTIHLATFCNKKLDRGNFEQNQDFMLGQNAFCLGVRMGVVRWSYYFHIIENTSFFVAGMLKIAFFTSRNSIYGIFVMNVGNVKICTLRENVS